MAITATSHSTRSSKIPRAPLSTQGGDSKEENIFVIVRIRPLSKKEIAHKDTVTWTCVDDRTISYNSSSQECSSSPSSYTFDKVFGPTSQTDIVYEQGTKAVALSALAGINATIFAYGQTSSGKTYTLRGIIKSSVCDIYKHIQNSPERIFTIKISALEIYNETVRDLLKPDSAPLRLLDDPEKGTVIEKLEEETAKDSQHLKYLIAFCDAQRQVGETSMNDASSRSHQIIRLTVESRLLEASDCLKSCVACLIFVDLAGSERTFQTNAESVRLKEGCYINRSLLALTSVIRKLSMGKGGGHIPYRDSKLTRILQISLGGNARTAIICTMSPALTHVEQSRNTLSFATRAKEVTNNAQVNMVTSDKQLVKYLQKKVARLKAELHTSRSTRSLSKELLKDNECKIKKLEMEMEKLKHERDFVRSKLKTLQMKVNETDCNTDTCNSPSSIANFFSFNEVSSINKDLGFRTANSTRNAHRQIRQTSTVPLMLVCEIQKLNELPQEKIEEEANRTLEVLYKEDVSCPKIGNQNSAKIRNMHGLRHLKEVKCGDVSVIKRSPHVWQSIFKEQKQQIIHLWDVCYISIIHRTQFYLLFNGDPSDQIYIEVELRRLTWLQKYFADIGKEECPSHLGEELTMFLSSSIRSLECERIFLSKQMNSEFTEVDRDILYYKWKIPINAKQRRFKLACKLWTDPNDSLHIEESAQLVAELTGFCKSGGYMLREMFELNFAFPPSHKKPWILGWNQIANLLRN